MDVMLVSFMPDIMARVNRQNDEPMARQTDLFYDSFFDLRN